MHEIIEFKTNPAGRLLTICPHDMADYDEDGRKHPRKVCSDACQACVHFVSMHNTDGIQCSYMGDHADKAMDARDDAAASAQGAD